MKRWMHTALPPYKTTLLEIRIDASRTTLGSANPNLENPEPKRSMKYHLPGSSSFLIVLFRIFRVGDYSEGTKIRGLMGIISNDKPIPIPIRNQEASPAGHNSSILESAR
uniref:Uncharacterized protein n=1 Tax=Candidatus Kentrum sp. FW TaxID=2126338 RepID=A0A450TB93_9GAMM|nr:MAG: hypothetical protein BECKFW1821B_GA0114236_10906 [Candidatus Kentron sp. FW]